MRVSPKNCIDGASPTGDTDGGRSMRHEKAQDVQTGRPGPRVRYLCGSAFHAAHVARAKNVLRRNAVSTLQDMPSRRVVSTKSPLCSYSFPRAGCRKTGSLLGCPRPSRREVTAHSDVVAVRLQAAVLGGWH